MTRLRVWLVGFGTVGRWLVRALDAEGERIARRHGAGIAVVGIASARNGFVHDARGFDPRALAALAARGGSLAELPPAHRARRDPRHGGGRARGGGLEPGRQLRPEDVGCEGVTGVTPAQIEAARSRGARVKHVATLAFSEPDGGGTVAARVRRRSSAPATRWRVSTARRTPSCSAPGRSAM